MKKYLLLLLYTLGCFQGVFAQSKKIVAAYKAIESNYVDAVNSDSLTANAIQGMLQALDPHSTYLSKEQVESSRMLLAGSFMGIGIQCVKYKDTLCVVQVYANSSAAVAGLEVGDRIVSRNSKQDFTDVNVVRNGQQFFFHLHNTSIPQPSLESVEMLDSITGYVYIKVFGATTPQEFDRALTFLQKQGMKHLILDLRGNSGGLFQSAIAVANQLLPEGKLIVSCKGNHYPEEQFKAKPGGKFTQNPLCVLMDEHSASASEVVAGAIQDWNRGSIIGQQSYGKGLIQTPIDLPDHAQIRLTTARYYTPLGRCIQKSYSDYSSKLNDGGIIPNIALPLDTALFSSYYSYVQTSGLLEGVVNEYYLQHWKELKQNYPEEENWMASFQIPNTALLHLFNEAQQKNALLLPSDEQKAKFIVSLQMKALLASYLWGPQAYHELWNSTSQEVNTAIKQMNKK